MPGTRRSVPTQDFQLTVLSGHHAAPWTTPSRDSTEPTSPGLGRSTLGTSPSSGQVKLMPSPCEQWRAQAFRNRPVCRSLFGPVDRRQLRLELGAELWRGLDAAAKRWAFDFEAERPLPGDLQWEAVPNQDVPSFYRTVHVTSQGRLLNPLGPREGVEMGTPSAEKKPILPHGRKRRQALITDFYVMKRRFVPLDAEAKP
ncbi:cyclin-dependent kinase inhibitor 1-like isoform X1 [Hypanus sabinus]|uniref:cyclin-dependent kinase inhibitor 1-like isoform X1 n=1 Tax=Hypanus sabinus TaxID=79690 RepID=UPI0028C43EF1|nr:cyclin-dependent kinase inhibitor 1-like isoform X1 [Hypanus sabinus]